MSISVSRKRRHPIEKSVPEQFSKPMKKSGVVQLSQILTLDSLQELTHAYDSFTTIEGSDLPEYYKGVFPHTCRCGAEIIMTNDPEKKQKYTQLQCCNPDCWVKMAYKFAHFAKTLGFKDFGATSALALYEQLHEQFEYPTFLYIFKLPIVEIQQINGDAYATNFRNMRDSVKEDAWQFKDAIAALGIPDIGKNCALFDVVKDPVTFLGFVLKKRIPELCNLAGIYAPKTLFALDIARIDIVTLMSEVMPHILSTPKSEVYVAITGSVTVDGVYMPRHKFIELCESIKDDKGNQAYKLVETKAENKLEYVIADAPSNSSKYVLGQRINKLVTAQKFYEILQSNIGGGNNE